MLQIYTVLEELLDLSKRVVAKGTVLKSETEDSHARFYVEQGWLAASKSLVDGEQQILEFILPDETYDPTAADGSTSFVQLEALCDAVVATIDRTTWERVLQDHPELWHGERRRDIAARARLSERMLRLGKSSAETRIAYVLIELWMRMNATQAAENCSFHVPLNQKQLGDFAGLCSVHVCRTLRRLNRSGIITSGDHLVIAIHDLPALAELADVDLTALRDRIIPAPQCSFTKAAIREPLSMPRLDSIDEERRNGRISGSGV